MWVPARRTRARCGNMRTHSRDFAVTVVRARWFLEDISPLFSPCALKMTSQRRCVVIALHEEVSSCWVACRAVKRTIVSNQDIPKRNVPLNRNTGCELALTALLRRLRTLLVRTCMLMQICTTQIRDAKRLG